FSGGAHAKSPLTCILLGTFITPLLGKAAALTAPFLTPSGIGLIIAAGFLPSLVVIWRLAPVDSPAKPVAAPEQRRKLRFLSVTGVLLITAAQLVYLLKGQAHPILLAISLGLWWQAFTLTRSGHWFATFTDNIIKKGGVSG
ncbi:MAG: accessory gene regulator B family protein, partial [Bacillota bacterium]